MARICFDSGVLLKIIGVIIFSIFVYNIFCGKKHIVEGNTGFAAMDTNGDGSISTAEYEAAGQKMAATKSAAGTWASFLLGKITTVDAYPANHARWSDSDKDQVAKLSDVKGTKCEKIVKYGFQYKEVQADTPIYLYHGCNQQNDGWRCVKPGYSNSSAGSTRFPAYGDGWTQPYSGDGANASKCPAGYCYRPVGWVWHGREHAQLCSKPDPDWVSPEEKLRVAKELALRETNLALVAQHQAEENRATQLKANSDLFNAGYHQVAGWYHKEDHQCKEGGGGDPDSTSCGHDLIAAKILCNTTDKCIGISQPSRDNKYCILTSLGSVIKADGKNCYLTAPTSGKIAEVQCGNAGPPYELTPMLQGLGMGKKTLSNKIYKTRWDCNNVTKEGTNNKTTGYTLNECATICSGSKYMVHGRTGATGGRSGNETSVLHGRCCCTDTCKAPTAKVHRDYNAYTISDPTDTSTEKDKTLHECATTCSAGYKSFAHGECPADIGVVHKARWDCNNATKEGPNNKTTGHTLNECDTICSGSKYMVHGRTGATGGQSAKMRERSPLHGRCYCTDTCKAPKAVAHQNYNTYNVSGGQCTDVDDKGTCICSKDDDKSTDYVNSKFRTYQFSTSFCKSKLENKRKLQTDGKKFLENKLFEGRILSKERQQKGYRKYLNTKPPWPTVADAKSPTGTIKDIALLNIAKKLMASIDEKEFLEYFIKVGTRWAGMEGVDDASRNKDIGMDPANPGNTSDKTGGACALADTAWKTTASNVVGVAPSTNPIINDSDIKKANDGSTTGWDNRPTTVYDWYTENTTENANGVEDSRWRHGGSDSSTDTSVQIWPYKNGIPTCNGSTKFVCSFEDAALLNISMWKKAILPRLLIWDRVKAWRVAEKAAIAETGSTKTAKMGKALLLKNNIGKSEMIDGFIGPEWIDVTTTHTTGSLALIDTAGVGASQIFDKLIGDGSQTNKGILKGGILLNYKSELNRFLRLVYYQANIAEIITTRGRLSVGWKNSCKSECLDVKTSDKSCINILSDVNKNITQCESGKCPQYGWCMCVDKWPLSPKKVNDTITSSTKKNAAESLSHNLINLKNYIYINKKTIFNAKVAKLLEKGDWSDKAFSCLTKIQSEKDGSNINPAKEILECQGNLAPDGGNEYIRPGIPIGYSGDGMQAITDAIKIYAPPSGTYNTWKALTTKLKTPKSNQTGTFAEDASKLSKV